MVSLRQVMFGVSRQPPSVDRFLLGEKLGAGGMGIVYAARDPRLERKIALKLVQVDREFGPKGEARLLREARSMARLAHPNVVQIYEVGEWEGRVFIAMELVRGRTLAAWLAQSPRKWQEVIGVFRMAGRGLAAAHAAGVVHRDFKPENVLIGDDGHVRVTDFGLAIGQAIPDEASTPSERASSERNPAGPTTTGAFAGTPAYMAPELFLGRPASAASDQFSFCVALYHALHGQHPFAGEDRAALARAIVAGQVRPPRSRIPGHIHRAVIRGLSSAPAQRFPTMDALLAALEPGSDPRVLGIAAGGAVAGFVLLAALLRDWRTVEPMAVTPTVPCVLSQTRFEATNAADTYRVPSGCTTIRVQTWGGGGGGALAEGGSGGYAEARFTVTPGQDLAVEVGLGGGHWAIGGTRAFTGGSYGGGGNYAGAASGGYSGVRDGNEWLIVAGGGGGGGASGEGGGGGGGGRGHDGFPLSAMGGHGGTPESPGAGGASVHGAASGNPGHGMRGGTGGSSASGIGGGAGGGGYQGGGGGGGDGWPPKAGGSDSGGGGGGSGYVHHARAIAGSLRLETPERLQVANAAASRGAGRGGARRLPNRTWLKKNAVSEATAGRPGLIILTVGETMDQ